jgi:hypothetical protein
MKKFSSSIDQTSYVISYVFISVIVAVAIAGFFAYRKSGGDSMPLFFTGITAIFLVVIFAAMYMLRTKTIDIGSSGIVIDRSIKPVTIPYQEIKSVTLLSKQDMGRVVRTFGNGGLFGYTGLYYNKKHGSMTWYCTNRKSYILIEKNDEKKIVITPDDPQDVLHELKAQKAAQYITVQ